MKINGEKSNDIVLIKMIWYENMKKWKEEGNVDESNMKPNYYFRKASSLMKWKKGVTVMSVVSILFVTQIEIPIYPVLFWRRKKSNRNDEGSDTIEWLWYSNRSEKMLIFNTGRVYSILWKFSWWYILFGVFCFLSIRYKPGNGRK